MPIMILATAFTVLLPSVLGAYNDSTDYSSGALGTYPIQSFHTSNYTAPEFNFQPYPPTTPPPGCLFVAPRGPAVNRTGAIIVDWQGNLIWDGSMYGETMSFSKQVYLGQDVITVWVGEFNAGGYGDGYNLILDQTYTVVANVSTSLANERNDFHDFQITTNNTGLITVYSVEQYDLSSFDVTTTDGSQGWIIQGYAQEINITSGEAIWTWASLDHVDPSASYANPGETGGSQDNPWDYFHINSIDKDSKGNYLLSSRHCHALYYVSGADGHIIWTIGGMNSSFDMGNGTVFEWQHDARWYNNETQITVFDNAGTIWETDGIGRGLLLNIDYSNMNVTLATEFLAPTGNASSSQGSIQIQSNGNALLGWGQQPWISEYDSTGNQIWAAQFGLGASGVQSYRALRSNWTGYPHTNPSISLVANSSTSAYDAYVSWSGATEVGYWMLVGSQSTDGQDISTWSQTNRTAFETVMSVQNSAVGAVGWLQGVGYHMNGSVLGYSDWVAKDGSKTSPPTASQTGGVTVGTASFTSAVTTPSSTSSSTSSSTPGSAELTRGLGRGGSGFAGGMVLMSVLMGMGLML